MFYFNCFDVLSGRNVLFNTAQVVSERSVGKLAASKCNNQVHQSSLKGFCNTTLEETPRSILGSKELRQLNADIRES